MRVRLMLIRHGESENNRIQADTGSWDGRLPDPDLTDLGRLQALRLAGLFATSRLPRPDVLYTSLMRRAVATAQPIAEALDMPLTGHLQLYEVGGVFEGPDEGPSATGIPVPGHSASALQQVSPRLVLPAGVDENGWYRTPFETPSSAWHRASRVLDELSVQHGGSDAVVAVVTHVWISQLLLRAVLDWPPTDGGELTGWLALNNTGHALVETNAGAGWPPVIRWVNRTDHLRESDLTG